MKILGIDPGYERLGVSIIEKQKIGKPKLLFSECFKTSAKDEHSLRLSQILLEIEEVIKKYKPTHLGIETLFFNANVKTAMKVAESRGVVLATAKKEGLEICELSPQAIKIAVTGYGNSDKKAVMKMIPLLIDIPDSTSSVVANPAYSSSGVAKKNSVMLDDEYDAIAVGLCVLAQN
jgi:crossover junction endodeoxyribonuclease RuvC